MQKNLTSGSVFKNILSFSLPYLLSYFLQTLYGMADLFLIGRYGEVDGTTAVSIGSQVMHMLTVMIVGLAMGATVMIGQAVGAQNRAKVNRYIGNTITLFVGAAAVLTLAMLSLSKGIVRLMSTPEAAQAGTEAYLRICFAGLPFIIAYNVISAIFRGMGDSKSPMYFIAAACAANIGLDLLFMGPLALGPAGAALGTTLSQAFSVVLSLIVVVRRRMLPGLAAAHLRPQREYLGDMVKIGVPVALQDGFIQVSFLAITVFANLRGLNDAAAVGIVEKIIGILFLVPSTMLSTVSALAAQNIGAGKPQRAREVMRDAIFITAGVGLVLAGATQFCAVGLVGLFTESDTVALMGSQYLRSYVWDCLLAGIHFCISGYFCACGVSGYSFAHNAISTLCARLPLSWLASRNFPGTLFPMGCAAPAGSLVSVLVCGVLLRILAKKQAAEDSKAA